MTRRNTDELSSNKDAAAELETESGRLSSDILSPQGSQTSPRSISVPANSDVADSIISNFSCNTTVSGVTTITAPSPLNGEQESPSSPMLATMTPVNMVELKKDANDIEQGISDHTDAELGVQQVMNQVVHHGTEVYHVKTEMVYPSNRSDTELYAHNINVKHHTPIDLIYEDGNKTVIYTTSEDQKGLEMYSSQTPTELTISSMESHAHIHAHTHVNTHARSHGQDNDQSHIHTHSHSQTHLHGPMSEVLLENNGTTLVTTASHCDSSEDGLTTSMSPVMSPNMSPTMSPSAMSPVRSTVNNSEPVSVVLHAGSQGLLQYPQSQVAATTVLVLSELVEDISAVPVLGFRKRRSSKEVAHSSSNNDDTREGTSPLPDTSSLTSSTCATSVASTTHGHGVPVRMTELISEHQQHTHSAVASTGPISADHEQQSWRAYHEHPLTAATTAMLNISGGGVDDQATTMGFIYEYYKLPSLTNPDSALKEKITDIWPASSQPSGILTSHLKATNGLVNGAGLEISTPPLNSALSATQLGTQTDIGLFINQHVGYTQPVCTTSNGQNFHIVKREPEDLSHHRKLEVRSPDQNVGAGNIIYPGKPRTKVVLVSSAESQATDLVVDVSSGHGMIKDEVHIVRGLESPQHSSRSVCGTPTSSQSSLLTDGSSTPIELISADGIKTMYTTQIFTTPTVSGSSSPGPFGDHTSTVQYAQSTLSGSHSSNSNYISSSVGLRTAANLPFSVSADPYYREYFTTGSSPGPGNCTSNTAMGNSVSSTGVTTHESVYPAHPAQLRQAQIGGYVEANEGSNIVTTASIIERYVRQSNSYHNKSVIAAASTVGLTVDLPSPDSGIGADAITPREHSSIQSFDYTELCQSNSGLLDANTLNTQRSTHPGASPGNISSGRSRPWHDFGRQNDADKIQISKTYSLVGFKYHLETPISTSQRREDDRITYINKGQFYGITLEYIPDHENPLKSQTVKSVVMLMFREEKSPEDEIKAWQFWHGRQHSVKQRILDADTKNSVGLVGCIEEVAHNAIAVYWNPMDSSAKINVAVQCLSTDFSSQKGVKGLPLHLQIDTYEDPRDTVVHHRGYCQIKVFCDKGAERKTRDEERRAAKRKMTATGRKKLDELYHPVSERSEFYSMSDVHKSPVLFTPAEDIDKLTSMELQGFYNHDADNTLTGGTGNEGIPHLKSSSPFLLHMASKPPTTPILKFHNHFPPDADKKDGILDGSMTTDGTIFSPPLKKPKILGGAVSSGIGHPPLNERVMLYVRQETEDVYTPLHVVPPTTAGLLNAIENKYKIDSSRVNNLFRKNRKGILAKIDDEMVTYYCNEDLFLLEVKAVNVDDDLYDITFIELPDH